MELAQDHVQYLSLVLNALNLHVLQEKNYENLLTEEAYGEDLIGAAYK
jgi:hypothetical protein